MRARFAMFWNWIGRTQEEIEQARRDWMEGTRFGEVKGYDGAPLPAPELPAVPLKPRGRVRRPAGMPEFWWLVAGGREVAGRCLPLFGRPREDGGRTAGGRLSGARTCAGVAGGSTVWPSVGSCGRTLADLMLTSLAPRQLRLTRPFRSSVARGGLWGRGGGRTNPEDHSTRSANVTGSSRRLGCRSVKVTVDVYRYLAPWACRHREVR
ncbi:hypothetical protein GCM10027073_56300 [Streptomyces chlorus]